MARGEQQSYRAQQAVKIVSFIQQNCKAAGGRKYGVSQPKPRGKTFTAPSTHFILVTCHRAELFQQGSSIIYCQHVGWGRKGKTTMT